MKFANKKRPVLASKTRLTNALAAAIFAASCLMGLGANAQSRTSDLVSKTEFRVCADPANWPQSDEAGDGYENVIANLMADALGREKVKYFYFPMSTGFVRNSLAANQCDVIIGFSAGHELVLNTNPYYSSTYVLVAKKGSDFDGIDHLSDPKLAEARIGLTAGSAPADHLVRLGLIGHVVPYQLFTDRRHSSPTEDMLNDLMEGKTDIAVIWGPIGGPFVKRDYPELTATPLYKEEGKPSLVARITMGVRQGETNWKRELNSQLRRHEGDIDAILREAGVPLANALGDGPKAEKR